MQRVVILGAGFGGLELATALSEAVSEDVDVALIDKSDGFVFGYSKLDVMFGRTTRPLSASRTVTSRNGACASFKRRSPRSTPKTVG